MTEATSSPYLQAGQRLSSALGQYSGNSGLSDAGNALGIYGGLQRGGVGGYGSAAVNAAKLYGNLSGNQGVTQSAGALGNVLGIYNGIQQGGVSGYGHAAVNAGTLAGVPGVGYLAAPLALYDFGKGWHSGATGADAMSGAETGAEIGSYFGPLGTVAGGVIGAAGGALSSAFGPGAKDPETYAAQGVINATSSHGNNPEVAASAQNPYLELAGLMDRRSSTLPEYAQYGRMGEQQFTNDLVGKINQAVKADPSLANNPGAVYNQVISPWVNSMGSGYKDVGQAYTATNQGLIADMVNQYMSGDAATDWKSIGGQEPFSGVYNNSPFESQYQTVMKRNPQLQEQLHVAPTEYDTSRGTAMNTGVRAAAEGGHMAKRKSSVLDKIRPSFQDAVRHYEDGGSVSYDPNNLYVTPVTYSGPAYDFNLNGPSGNDPNGDPSNFGVGSPSNNDLSGFDFQQTNQQGIDSINNPYGGSGALSSASSGLGGILSSLGLGSVGSAIQNYGALAPLLAAALGSGNKGASAPATPSGYSNSVGPLPAASYNRTYTQPNVANWYTYGEGPEQSFFSNNQLPTVAGFSPQSATSGSAPATANTQPVLQTINPRASMAHGGVFNSPAGDDYVPDPGHGDGTSDDIDAKLSGGEYVLDAGTVSMLGNGSNEAGARALDQLRQRVRKHAGTKLVKGKQFMKAKAPEAYLRGGKS